MSSSPDSGSRRRAPLIAAALALGALFASSGLTAGASPAIAAEASQITLAATEVDAGGTVEVEYATDRPSDANWVAIYAADVPEPCSACGMAWEYAPGASGTVEVALHDRSGGDLAAGEYRIEYLYDDGYERIAEPAPFTIEGEPGTAAPGDPNAPVEIDPVATDAGTDGVIAREGFPSGLPDGWSIDTAGAEGSDAYRGWSFTTREEWAASIDEMRDRFARPLGTFAVADAQQFGGALDTTLTGAPVAVDGLGAIRLTFDSHYRGAAGQSGTVSVSFDGGETAEILRLDPESVADDYDARQLNYAQDVEVDVPVGAEEAVFSWRLDAPAGARYWAIDSVEVHQVQRETAAEPTQAWVMSDIQGHPQDWQHAIGDYAEIAPDADAMMIVGDHVNSGTSAEWDEIYAVRDQTADVRPAQTISAIGNHERYAAGGFEANRDRFLAFAERDRVWGEYVLDGPAGSVPVIVLGQEFSGPSDVPMSDEQVEFLEQRLAHWTELDKQVVVLSHFPLGDTVSASWIPWYSDHHQMNDRLTSILGNYPNAVVLSGHTHYPAELGDWAVQRRTADGHADGFWAVNTLAMHIEWDARGENTEGIDEVTTRDINQGLTLDSYGDRIVVTAYDFASDEQLRQVTIPNPLVPYDEETQEAPDPDDQGDGGESDGDGSDDGSADDGAGDDGSGEGSDGEGSGGSGGDASSVGSGGGAGATTETDGAAQDGELAVTGADVPWAIGLGAAGLLIAAGTALVLRRRARNA